MKPERPKKVRQKDRLEIEWQRRQEFERANRRPSSLPRREIDRLLKNRERALNAEVSGVISTRPPDPRRKWRTWDKPGPVTVRKVW